MHMPFDGSSLCHFEPFGDSALHIYPTQPAQAIALFRNLQNNLPAGAQEIVLADGMLTLLFFPLATDHRQLATTVCQRLQSLATAQANPQTQTSLLIKSRRHVFIVRFGGKAGPDLAACAAHLGLSEDDWVTQFCQWRFRVAFLGFSAGFGFLRGLPSSWQMPRRATPRLQVAAGSVALGGPWAGIYPRATAGGWQVVGQTSVALLDVQRQPAVLWQAGDEVQFVPQ